MITERHVADVCPTCGGKRESRAVFATRCEAEMLKVVEHG